MSAWLPTDAATPLALWIDPADAATVTIVSSRITQITDKSGNGRTFVARTATGPLTTTQNGKTAILGNSGTSNGNNKLYHAGSGLNGVTNGPNTYVSAAGVYSQPATTQAAFLVMAPSAPPTNRIYAWLKGTDQAFTWRHGSAVANSTGTPANAVAVQTRSGTQVTGYLNGAQDGAGAIGVNFTSPDGGHWIGGWNAATSGWALDGWVGDCIIYTDVLSTIDRQKLEGYLAHKWGLAGSLPADHPYKAGPPINLIQGAAQVSLQPLFTTANGQAIRAGSVGAVLTPLGTAASGSLPIKGSAGVVLGPVRAIDIIAGSVAAVLKPVAALAGGALRVAAAGSILLQPLVAILGGRKWRPATPREDETIYLVQEGADEMLLGLPGSEEVSVH